LTASFWNAQVRDQLTYFNGLFTAWISWTPVLRAGGVNVTLGSGSTASGRYMRVGTVVFGEFFIQFGSSGVSVGAGALDFSSLPVTATGQAEANVPIGSVFAIDATGSTVIGVLSVARNFYSDGAGNFVWTNTVPFTWAANDTIRGSFTYQCAAPA
jgi:hypothetical protein